MSAHISTSPIKGSSSRASIQSKPKGKGPRYAQLDTSLVDLPAINRYSRQSKSDYMTRLAPTNLGLRNFWMEQADDIHPPSSSVTGGMDYDEYGSSSNCSESGVGGFEATLDLQSFAESQATLAESFARSALKTPPHQRERIWRREAAARAVVQAQRDAAEAEFAAFAVPGTPKNADADADDDDDVAEVSVEAPLSEFERLGIEAQKAQGYSQATLDQLASHDRPSIRGVLTKDEAKGVIDIKKRIRERKVERQRLQDAADIDARRDKVMFDDDATKMRNEAAARREALQQQLKKATVASKLKEQGKSVSTGKIDTGKLTEPSTNARDRSSNFIQLTKEQREQKDKAREASKIADALRTANDASPGPQGRVSPVPRGDSASEEAKEAHIKALRSESDRQLREQFANYFGPAARSTFKAGFKRAARDLRVIAKDEDVPEEMNTPRRTYLRESEKLHLLPIPVVLRKETQKKGVFLAHKGLGDRKLLPLVAIIDTLPAVESVDLCDNRLTDVSLMPLMKKLVNIPTLLYLDLSFNDMDDSSVTIQEFIRSSNCNLHTLLINASDVDDYECVNLCDALIENRTIHTLGLARNLIGNDEHMKVTDTNRVLGGDGLAKMLAVNTTITSLDLEYNQLRLSGAMALGKSLAENTSLKILKLAFNSFGDLGTQWLGHSLKSNKALEKIDLRSNSLVPRSVCVLANALAQNDVLYELILDDNILGRVGAQAIAAAIQRSSQSKSRRTYKLMISFQNCDCFKIDPNVFDPATPGGKWTLNLAEPYGAMIVEECFFLANFRAGCQIKSLKYNKLDVMLERKQSSDKDAFNLQRLHDSSKKAASSTIKGDFREAAKSLEAVLSEFRFKMPYKMRTRVVEKVADQWKARASDKERSEDLHEVFLVEVFVALFVINDADNSETMDVAEFIETLASLGFPDFNETAAVTLMEEHDRDLSGTIDGAEFSMIMVKEFCRTDLPRGIMVDVATKKPWELPADGSVVVDVAFEIDAPSSYDVGSDEGIMTLIKGIQSAKTGEQKDILFGQACASPYFYLTAEQAQILFDDSCSAGLSKLPLDMIISIMPQIVNEEQVNRFLDQNLNEKGKLSLRIRMGPLYNAFIGLATGHYFIDFEKVLDTMGAKRLAALSVSETRATKVIGARTSQKGNGSNFRNEMKGVWGKQEPIAVDGQWFANPPSHGELRFDYVSTKRPLVGTLPLATHRLNRMVKKLRLHTIVPIMDNLAKLNEETRTKKKKKDKKKLEGVDPLARKVVDPEDAPKGDDDEPPLNEDGEEDLLEMVKPKAPLSMALVREQFYETIATCHHHCDILPREIMRDVSRMNYNPDPDFRPETPPELHAGDVPSKRKMPEIYPYAYQKLLELQVMMPSIYLTIAQVSEIIYYFPSCGYLRVQFLLSTFSHIIDLENLYMIYDLTLNDDEKRELTHRLGIMNIFDPLSPDREYKLDLRRWDEREWCKILIQLSIQEPGDNWVGGGEYRWSKYDEGVPGWILPAPWATRDEFDDPKGVKDAGPRRYGWLRAEYTSTDEGCEANMTLRRTLRKRTLAGLKQLL